MLVKLAWSDLWRNRLRTGIVFRCGDCYRGVYVS